MNKLNVCGIGPGHVDYILPIVFKLAEESDILIGSQRHLQDFKHLNKEEFILESNYSEMINLINESINTKKITVLVSGDTGFYSLTKYLNRNLKDITFNVVPGISSLQYMFSRINESYDDAFLSSLHGKEFNYVEKLNEYRKIGLLTDRNNTPKVIAKTLFDAGYENAKVFVGENLSYDNEVIKEIKANELKEEFSSLSVVVIINE